MYVCILLYFFSNIFIWLLINASCSCHDSTNCTSAIIIVNPYILFMEHFFLCRISAYNNNFHLISPLFHYYYIFFFFFHIYLNNIHTRYNCIFWYKIFACVGQEQLIYYPITNVIYCYLHDPLVWRCWRCIDVILCIFFTIWVLFMLLIFILF